MPTTPRSAFRVFETLPVRWGDMDAMGHVNNAAYFTYCESARMRYFTEIDIEDGKEGAEHGPAVVTATCNFRRQVHWPATLAVGVRAARMGRSSFTLEYALFLEATDEEGDEPVADGSSVVVWVDYGAGESIPLPEALRERIRELDGIE